MKMLRRTPVALLAAGALLLAACGGEEDEPDPGATDDTEETEDGDGTEDGDDTGDGEFEQIGEGEEIEIAFIPWDEAIAVSNLWAAILEDHGFEVTLTQADVAPTFEGVSSGEYDLFFDMWLPGTHSDYQDEYGDDLEELGTWFDDAALTWTVPEYVDVDSIDELPDNADTFGSEIIGIESGAGLTRISKEEVIPTYGLEDWDLVESSTPAMLSELRNAINNEDPIVVTLWHPHWAYSEFDLKDLEDPETALGEAEYIQSVGRPGFSEDHPEVADFLGNFELNNDEVAELSTLVLGVEDEDLESPHDDEREAARAWVEDNRDTVEGWLGM